MTAIQLLDASPVRVEVDLREHARDVRRDAHRVAEELGLRLGVLLRGIRDEEHRVRRRQSRERRQRVRRVQSAHARRVDEREPALQKLAGQRHLGSGDVRNGALAAL
jgi:hypothetical protein